MAQGGKAAALAFDLANPAQRVGIMDRASELFGPVDIVINNAAINNYAPPSSMTLAFRRILLEVNTQGPIDLIQQALPNMKAKGWGRVINIVSASRQQGELPYHRSYDGLGVYGSSKVALERFTVGLAVELHRSGITVNAYYPTAVCVTGANSEAAIHALRHRPELGEGVEMMVEAGMLLMQSGMTGVVLPSREILFQHQAPLYALDGTTVIGDANTLADLGA